MTKRLIAAAILMVPIAAGGAVACSNVTQQRAITFDRTIHDERPGKAAVLFSGDAGFLGHGLGAGPEVAHATEGLGLPVYGVSSLAAFKVRRTLPQTALIVDDAVRLAMRKYGASRILLMGHSFGADVVGVALPDLAPDVRAALIGVVLIVPTDPVYLRADPTTLSYHGRPDARSDRAGSVRWTRILCIYGAQEADSLCPSLTASNVTRIALPGGHALHHDTARLANTLASGTRPMLERSPN